MKTLSEYTTTSSVDLPSDCYCFTYAIGVMMWFSKADVAVLTSCSEKHYDSHCRSYSERANLHGRKNGFLSILSLMLAQDGERTATAVTVENLDTLAKCLELSHLYAKDSTEQAASIRARVREAFKAITAEYTRLRGDTCNYVFSTEPSK